MTRAPTSVTQSLQAALQNLSQGRQKSLFLYSESTKFNFYNVLIKQKLLSLWSAPKSETRACTSSGTHGCLQPRIIFSFHFGHSGVCVFQQLLDVVRVFLLQFKLLQLHLCSSGVQLREKTTTKKTTQKPRREEKNQPSHLLPSFFFSRQRFLTASQVLKSTPITP